MHLSLDIDIAAPKSQVWSAITDIENCAQMISGVVKVKVLEQPSSGVLGLKWRETRVMFGKEADETMWVTEAEHEQYYQTRAENHGTVYISRMTVRDNNGGTQLSMSFQDEPQSMLTRIVSKCMGVFMAGSMKKMIQKDLQDIKQFVENKSAG